ncbi:MAG: hypothetical protein AB7I50_17755 [Vicinamibacterales bacterium]
MKHDTARTTMRHAPEGSVPVERRSATRVDGAHLTRLEAHLVDGPTVEIVNVSKTGILTRSQARLVPGSMIGLRVVTDSDTYVLFGRVVRSQLMSTEEGGQRYESALAFTQHFPLLADDSRITRVAPAPGKGLVTGRTDRAYPIEVGQLSGAPIILTVSAFADERQDVLKAIESD